MSSLHLRRYTDLPSLLKLLTERQLTLVDPQSWDDANDSHYMNVYREGRGHGSVLALCFTQVAEKYHHWRVFADGAAGVCVTFTRAKLLRAVKAVEGIRTDEVDYLTLSQIHEEEPDIDRLPFLKRAPFVDEREFRMIWCSPQKAVSSFDIAIPLSCIDRITLSPWLHDSLTTHVKKLINDLDGCSDLKVVRSTLIGNSEWKGFGDSLLAAPPTKALRIPLNKLRRVNR